MEPNTDRILTAPEAAKLLRLSTRTLQRLSDLPDGPRKIQLSERRIGYLEREITAFITARAAA